jgi:transcriptional regulator with PAS, ATPase and Fis domain
MRKGGPFVTVNCASLPESLLEAELFGYTEGSFTGATKGGRPGLFEQADGGTIFLDEIGQISSHLQILLLRVLQEKEVRRIGDTQLRPVDVRIIAASNKKLIELVGEGIFREDLYYRLNVLNLSIPPLRDRKEDIPLLASHFLNKFPARSTEPVLTSTANAVLQQYDWPGNVRQLENIVKRLLVTIDNKKTIDSEDVEQTLMTELNYQEHSKSCSSKNAEPALKIDEKENLIPDIQNVFSDYFLNLDNRKEIGLLSEIENRTILHVLKSVNWNRQEAARILGIHSATIWRRLNKMKYLESNN